VPTRLNKNVVPLDFHQDQMADLITSQVNFGLAYVREARSAYESGDLDYAEVARKIAVNAYAAAVRFSARLPNGSEPGLVKRVEELEASLDGIVNQVDELSVRSIA